jgi:hypothetical protein
VLAVSRCIESLDLALQIIFRSVVVAKLLYAFSAWWGFTNATDRQRVNASLRCGNRCSYYPTDLPDPFEELCQAAEQRLFAKILINNSHLLHELLPPPTAASQNYCLRTRAHNKQLVSRSGHLLTATFLLACYTQTYTSQAFLLELRFVNFILYEYQSINTSNTLLLIARLFYRPITLLSDR